MPDPQGWTVYEKLVLTELDDLKSRITSIEENVVGVRIDIAQLKVQSGVWGGLAGLIPAVIGVVSVLALGGGGS